MNRGRMEQSSFPRRELVSKVLGTAAMLGAAAANAEVDYAGDTRSCHSGTCGGEVCRLPGRHGGADSVHSRAAGAGVGFLGGSNIIDVNNANIRVYIKLQGTRRTVSQPASTPVHDGLVSS